MPRLALPVLPGATLGKPAHLPLDERAAQTAVRFGGQEVLLYEPRGGAEVTLIGSGVLAGLGFGGTAAGTYAIVLGLKSGPGVTLSSIEFDQAHADSYLRLSDDVVVSLTQGAALTGFAEPAQTGFGAAEKRPPVEEVLFELQARALDVWESRCAITGEVVDAQNVMPIRPFDLGGPLHLKNLMPLHPDVATAWRHGDISTTTTLEITAVLERVSDEVRSRIEGRLRLPPKPEDSPDLVHLAYHRLSIFGQLG